jgi:hypothetical protein
LNELLANPEDQLVQDGDSANPEDQDMPGGFPAGSEDQLMPDGGLIIPEEQVWPIDGSTSVPEYAPRPFTPSGTGTVVDRAVDTDGKEFYTIMTPDENVFYLIIDNQRAQGNVYFLNAVTEADLLSFAQITELPPPKVTEQPPVAEVEPPADIAPAPSTSGGNIGKAVLIIALVILGGGAAWYFKAYRPKQQRAVAEEDYSEDEYDPYGDAQGLTFGDEEPSWYDDDERLEIFGPSGYDGDEGTRESDGLPDDDSPGRGGDMAPEDSGLLRYDSGVAPEDGGE